MITGGNWFPPDYPGIPCNITTSAPGECVSSSSVIWGVVVFSLAVCVCGIVARKLTNRVKKEPETTTTEKTKLLSIQIM